ncbi:hypothetical protein AB0J83_24415 [Actinoplanes sp. NPDC049596]|uniref:hypothetical protein n=1 Tax=unclassified Actinoplanes TaxID=2626549 RepID=UPI00342F7C8E
MRDEEYGALLLRPLDGEPDAPSKIDVAKAMRDGRHRRGRRWWAGGSALVAAVAAASVGGVLATGGGTPPKPKVLPPDPPMPGACVPAMLPIGGHPDANLTAGDPSGTWHAGVSEPNYHEPPVFNSLLIWRGGQLVTDAKAPASSFGVRDINGAGVAVGFSDTGANQPFAYRNGSFHKLAGGAGEPVAINDAGVIVGNVGPTENETRPVRWRSLTAPAEPLPLPAGVRPGEVRVRDIAEDGSIVAEIGRGGYLWSPDGTGRFLKPPKGHYPAPSMSPIPLPSGMPSVEARLPFPDTSSAGVDPQFTPLTFARGWIYGHLLSESSITLPYRYDPRSDTWQRLGDASTQADLSGNGMFAGDRTAAYVGRALLTLPLPPEAASPKEGENWMSLTSIGDDARTVGGSMISGRADPSHRDRPVIWRCR